MRLSLPLPGVSADRGARGVTPWSPPGVLGREGVMDRRILNYDIDTATFDINHFNAFLVFRILNYVK